MTKQELIEHYKEYLKNSLIFKDIICAHGDWETAFACEKEVALLQCIVKDLEGLK
jgi:hypothetical protein